MCIHTFGACGQEEISTESCLGTAGDVTDIPYPFWLGLLKYKDREGGEKEEREREKKRWDKDTEISRAVFLIMKLNVWWKGWTTLSLGADSLYYRQHCAGLLFFFCPAHYNIQRHIAPGYDHLTGTRKHGRTQSVNDSWPSIIGILLLLAGHGKQLDYTEVLFVSF